MPAPEHVCGTSVGQDLMGSQTADPATSSVVLSHGDQGFASASAARARAGQTAQVPMPLSVAKRFGRRANDTASVCHPAFLRSFAVYLIVNESDSATASSPTRPSGPVGRGSPSGSRPRRPAAHTHKWHQVAALLDRLLELDNGPGSCSTSSRGTPARPSCRAAQGERSRPLPA